MENTNAVTVINPACEELTGKIKGAMYNIAKEFVYIGFLLAECDYFESYKVWGYSSIHEYASHQLGFKKSSTYNFINVCKTFCQPTNALPFSYFMKEPYSKFNFSQLVEMLSMNNKQCSQVTPDMTVKQIREVKKASDEPEYAKLYNMQLKFLEFSEVYSRKINGKKFELSVSGKKCEPSDIWPDGYYISLHADILHNCGHGSGYNRVCDYEKFKELVSSYWNCYDDFNDSRRLEKIPAPEAPVRELDIVSYPGYDLLIPLKGDLRSLFKSIQEAYLKLDHNSSTDLFEMVWGFLKTNDFVICKKVNKKSPVIDLQTPVIDLQTPVIDLQLNKEVK